jgi:hypothetical protein
MPRTSFQQSLLLEVVASALLLEALVLLLEALVLLLEAASALLTPLTFSRHPGWGAWR